MNERMNDETNKQIKGWSSSAHGLASLQCEGALLPASQKLLGPLLPKTPFIPDLWVSLRLSGLWALGVSVECHSPVSQAGGLPLRAAASPYRLAPSLPLVQRLLAQVPAPRRLPAEDAGGVRSRLP